MAHGLHYMLLDETVFCTGRPRGFMR